MKTRLYFGREQSKLLQHFENLAVVAGHLTGSSKSSNAAPAEEVKVPQSAAELETIFKGMFGR